MRIFVTGATGYIGSAVTAAFVRAGHEVTALVRPSARPRALQQRGVQVVTGDLADIGANRHALAGFDVYVHAAFDASPRGPGVDRHVIETIRDVAEESGGAAFIYTSGVWVLGNTRAPADETAPVDPPAVVAHRPALEGLVLDANGGGMRAIVVRPGIVYGGSRGIIADMLRDAANGILRVIGTGDNRWPLVYDRDLADLYVRLATHPTASGLFHATDEGDERVNDLVRAMSAQVAHAPEVRYMPVQEARARLGPVADALALDQVVRSPRAKEIGWAPTMRSVARNVPRLFEEWRNREA
ncbi:MAG TPA: NAD-dependent epimerase/dehydratase family protein [Vicinamibacterales bacterium]